MKREWKITIWKGLQPVEEFSIPVSRFSEADIANVLRALVAKAAGLSNSDLAWGFCNERKGTERTPSLVVGRESLKEKRKTVLSCGTDPWATAEIIWD